MKRQLLASLTLSVATAVPLVPLAGAPTAAAVSCTVTTRLSPGAVSPQVECLEQRLVELGFAGIGTPDTVYSGASITAVAYFQQTRGLYPDGIVTSVTGRQLGVRGPLPTGPGTAKVTVIGDSTSAAMRWYDEANNVSTIYDVMGTSYDLQWSIESCRRLVNTSCVGRVDPGTGHQWRPVSVLPLMRTTLSGRLGQALVIMAGYDDTSITSAIPQIMAEAKAQRVAKVFWLTYRTTSSYGYGGYYNAHNAALLAARAQHPNLVVLDWNTYTHQQSAATQSSWFESDGIHMTRTGGTALAQYLKTAIDAADIRACVAANAIAGAPDPGSGTPATPPTGDTGFAPLTPTRVLDTRDETLGGGHGKLGAGRTVTIDLSFVLPPAAQAAAVSVAAVSPCGPGFLSVFACGVRPNTANVNFAAGRTTTGMAISLLSSRQICVYSSSAVDVVVDVVGAFTPTGSLFHPITPSRWVDARGNAALLPIVGPLSGGTQMDVPVAGRGGVPSDATAAWLNVTAIAPNAVGAGLLAYPGPCGASPPLAATVIAFPGRSASTAALVGLGSTGGVCVRAFGSSAFVVIDVAGWFGGSAPGGLTFHGIAPTRLMDTRGGAQPAAGSITPVGAVSTTVYNVAAIGSTGFGFVSAKPCGASDLSALLNTAPAENVANIGAVAPGAGGQVCISPSVAGHFAIDVTGTFDPTPT